MGYQRIWDIATDEVMTSVVGERIRSIEGLELQSEEVRITLENGNVFGIEHQQDCCEVVRLEEIAGIVPRPGDTIAAIELKTNEDKPNGDSWSDSYTWTFVEISTLNGGTLSMRWLGESNGYYGEEPAFYLQVPEK